LGEGERDWEKWIRAEDAGGRRRRRRRRRKRRRRS
jgi:hypothetical protein